MAESKAGWGVWLKDTAATIGGVLLLFLLLFVSMTLDGVLILIELVMVGYAARFMAWLFG